MAGRSIFGGLVATRRFLLPYNAHCCSVVGGGVFTSLNTILARTFMAKHVRPTLSTLSRRRIAPNRVAVDNRRSSYLEWNYTSELFAFSARLHETIDEELLRITFTERSYVEKGRSQEELEQMCGLLSEISSSDDGGGTSELSPVHNEQLAIDGLKIATRYASGWLRAALPQVPEEGIQSITDHLLDPDRLARLGQSLGMRDLLLTSDYPPSQSAFHQAVLALIGAVARSAPMDESGNTQQPIERAQGLVRDLIIAPICEYQDLHDVWPIKDPESVLSFVLESCGRAHPEPRLLRTAAPTHPLLAAYEVGFYVADGASGAEPRLLGAAPGSSIDEARQLAARVCLDSLMQIARYPLNLRRQITPKYTQSCSLYDWRPLDNK